MEETFTEKIKKRKTTKSKTIKYRFSSRIFLLTLQGVVEIDVAGIHFREELKYSLLLRCSPSEKKGIF